MNHHFDKHFKAGTLSALCEAYDLDPAAAKLIKEDSNLIYDCGDSILRISHSAIRTANDVAGELEWLDFLHQKGLPVVGIIRATDDRRSTTCGDADVHFTAVCFEKIRGRKISKETWKAAHFQKLGSLTGLIHRTNQKYPPKNLPRHQHWNELVECSYTTLLPEDERELQALNDRLVAEFNTYNRSPGTYGLIHNDIHHENYLLTGADNKIILFDFEVACQSWYIYEIATALYYASLVNRKRNDQEFERLFLDNFLIGYRQEYDLPAVDFGVVLKFMLYRDLFLHGYITAMWQHREQPQSIVEYLGWIDQSVAVRRERLGW